MARAKVIKDKAAVSAAKKAKSSVLGNSTTLFDKVGTRSSVVIEAPRVMYDSPIKKENKKKGNLYSLSFND